MPSNWSIRQYLLFENLKKFDFLSIRKKPLFIQDGGGIHSIFLTQKSGKLIFGLKKHCIGVPQGITVS